jgi:AcrR family transcriptional regulator
MIVRVTQPAPSRRAGGRTADPTIEPRALQAALIVFGETGWAGFTFDAVARVSKVGKAALYRRWTDKADLIVTAILNLLPPEIPETLLRQRSPSYAELRESLTEAAEGMAVIAAGPYGLAFLRAQIEAKIYPEIFGAAMERVRQEFLRDGRACVLAAIDRGELPVGTSPAMIMDALGGAIINHVIMAPPGRHLWSGDERRAYCERLADLILTGATNSAAGTPTSQRQKRIRG